VTFRSVLPHTGHHHAGQPDVTTTALPAVAITLRLWVMLVLSSTHTDVGRRYAKVRGGW
jgi:hypothetical protein